MNDLDNKTLSKLLIPGKISAIALFLVAIYIFGYKSLISINCTVDYLDNIFIIINNKFGIFNNKLYYHIFIFCLMTISFIPSDVDPQKRASTRQIIILFLIGLIFFFLPTQNTTLYIICTIIGFFSLMTAMILIPMNMSISKNTDEFNDIQESFSQCEEKMENDHSINLPTIYYMKNDEDKLETRHGWINIVNPYRACLVMGTPGSGKSFSFIEPSILQMLHKYFAMYLYDFKFPTLTIPAYNHFLWAKEKAIKLTEEARKNNQSLPKYIASFTNAQAYILNFECPAFSHRCNPLNARLVKCDTDAKDAAETIMMTLDPEARKKKDFFALSSTNFIHVNIMFLKQYKHGKYCTFAHLVEFMNSELDELFPILMSVKSLEGITKPFSNAFKEGAVEQLQGQVASAIIPLVGIAGENMWWVCTGEDFELDVNDPLEPKFLAIGNNPIKKDTYAPLISLYSNQTLKQANEQGKHRLAIYFDELPTIFANSINTVIATGRSNEIATFLGIQDNSQLEVGYGKEIATSIINTIGNFFSGQVQGDTAKFVSNLFGKNLQKSVSYTISADGTISKTINEARDLIIPENKVSNLTQGFFVGRVSDDFKQPIDKKLFHARVEIDIDQLKEDEKKYVDIPILHRFDKATANPIYFREILNYFNSLFPDNEEIINMMEEIMRLSDQDCIYEYNINHFNWEVDHLKYSTRNIIKTKLNYRKKLTQKTFNSEIKEKLIKYYIKTLINYDFLHPMGKYNGNQNRYYVTIWMKTHVRAHYYRIKQEVKDFVKELREELLSGEETQKLFRPEYLKRIFEERKREAEAQFGDDEEEAIIDFDAINLADGIDFSQIINDIDD